MTSSMFSCAMLRLPSRPLAGFLLNIARLMLGMLLATSQSYAYDAPPSGTNVWYRLGCWNCHGSNGSTHLSKPGSQFIAQLPLARFVGQVRLPVGLMPPQVPWLVSDADLAIVYHWLGGSDVAESPPAVAIGLKETASGRAEAQIEIEMTALRAQTALSSGVPGLTSLSYRVTLITNSNLPVVDRSLEYQQTGVEKWSKVTLHEDGEALLGPGRHFIVLNGREKGRARFRIAAPAVRTVFVVEALDDAQLAKPVIMGIGTVILKPPAERSRSVYNKNETVRQASN